MKKKNYLKKAQKNLSMFKKPYTVKSRQCIAFLRHIFSTGSVEGFERRTCRSHQDVLAQAFLQLRQTVNHRRVNDFELFKLRFECCFVTSGTRDVRIEQWRFSNELRFCLFVVVNRFFCSTREGGLFGFIKIAVVVKFNGKLSPENAGREWPQEKWSELKVQPYLFWNEQSNTMSRADSHPHLYVTKKVFNFF